MATTEGRLTLTELAERVVKVAGTGSYVVKPYPEERKRIDIGHYYADFSAIREVLGWKPSVDLDDGLARTVAYLREHLPAYLRRRSASPSSCWPGRSHRIWTACGPPWTA